MPNKQYQSKKTCNTFPLDKNIFADMDMGNLV